jgi:hypothetical protein
MGRIDEAIASGEIANRLNANLGPGAAFNLGMAYILKARYADAIKLVELASARYRAIPPRLHPGGRLRRKRTVR